MCKFCLPLFRICLFALLSGIDLILGLLGAVQESIGLIAGFHDVTVMS